jgi:alpha-L-fucosidase
MFLLRRIVSLTAVLLAGSLAFPQNFSDVKPTPQQVAWQDLEIGVLIHFGTNTFLDREWGDGKADAGTFNPTGLDAEQWVTAAKAAGARYLVLVAKHHDGFCLWPTRHTDYSVRASPWRDGKGDLVREVERATRKHGMKFGIYLSPWDRHEPAYKDNAAYDTFYRRQLHELITRYGEIVELWLDGAGSEGHVYDFESYVRELRTYQPNSLIFADTGFVPWGDLRWVGNEEGHAPEENWNVIDRVGYLRWRPAEVDTPLRKAHWFWHPNDQASLKSLDQLVETYHNSVGRGAQLMLGLAPDNRGLIPDVDSARLREFGDEIRRVYTPRPAKATAQPAAAVAVADGDIDTHWAAPSEQRSATATLQFASPVPFDRAVSMEFLNDGQHIHKYDIQVLQGSAWKTVAAGTSIGHKKIDRFPRVSASAARLRILAASGPIRVREFQVIDGGR